MAMPKEIADESAIFIDLLRTGAVADPCRLNNGAIRGLPFGDQSRHRIDQCHETMFVNRDLPPAVPIHHVREGNFRGDASNAAFLSDGRFGHVLHRFRVGFAAHEVSFAGRPAGG